MVFSSYIFVFYFLPLALLVTYALYRAPQRVRNLALALLGYAFYSWAAPKFAFLMLATTVFDWLLSIVIAGNSWKVWRTFRSPIESLVKGEPRSSTQRAAITLSVISNLMLLGFFKYFNFAMDSYSSMAEFLGLTQPQWHTALNIGLPAV